MEDIPATRAYLESLTTSELIRIADNYAIDIPPGLDRIFIVAEVLEAISPDEPAADVPADSLGLAGDESASSLKPGLTDSGQIEPVHLPKQYNITFIEVMIRDPMWAFVFWEVKVCDKEQFEKAQNFEGYYLKVSPLGKRAAALSESGVDSGFRISVRPEDNSWYLGLASALADGNSAGGETRAYSPVPSACPAVDAGDQNQYKVELCAGIKGEETIIIASNPFNLPVLHDLAAGAGPRGFAGGKHRPAAGKKPGQAENFGVMGNPLVHLSGYGDFHVLRKHERPLRAKNGVVTGSL